MLAPPRDASRQSALKNPGHAPDGVGGGRFSIRCAVFIAVSNMKEVIESPRSLAACSIRALVSPSTRRIMVWSRAMSYCIYSSRSGINPRSALDGPFFRAVDDLLVQVDPNYMFKVPQVLDELAQSEGASSMWGVRSIGTGARRERPPGHSHPRAREETSSSSSSPRREQRRVTRWKRLRPADEAARPRARWVG